MAGIAAIQGMHGEVAGLTITGVTDATRLYTFVGELVIGRDNNSIAFDPDASIFTITGQASDLTKAPREHYAFYGDTDPALGLFCYTHGNMAYLFDCWHNGTNFVASHTHCFGIYKFSDSLNIAYTTGTKGAGISLTNAGGTDMGCSFMSNGTTKLGKLVLRPSSDQSLADDAAITVNAPHVRVIGDGGATVLDTNPAIANGTYDGQILKIQGTSDANTVTIADACNTQLAGGASVVLGLNDIICLFWDSGESLWIEETRSDN